MADDEPVPSEQDDRKRVEADEAHLDEVQEQIDDAVSTHHEVEGSWLSGMIPEVEGHEGTGAADDLQT